MQSQILDPKSRIPSRFWPGFYCGNMAMLILIVVIVALSSHQGPTAGEQLLTCMGDLGLATAKVNALRSRATVIYEANAADIPSYGYHNLVEIRLSPALQSQITNHQSPMLKPRWIVVPGETPIELWKTENVAFAAYNLNTRKIETPTVVGAVLK